MNESLEARCLCVGGEWETSGGESVRKSGGLYVCVPFFLSCNPTLWCLSSLAFLPVGNE